MSNRSEHDATSLLRLAVASWKQFDEQDDETAQSVDGADLVEWFADFRKLCQQVLAQSRPPRVMLRVEGGIVQSVFADREAEVTIIDYDTEGEATDNLTRIPQDPNGAFSALANVNVLPADVMPTECDRIDAAVRATA